MISIKVQLKQLIRQSENSDNVYILGSVIRMNMKEGRQIENAIMLPRNPYVLPSLLQNTPTFIDPDEILNTSTLTNVGCFYDIIPKLNLYYSYNRSYFTKLESAE